MLSPVDHVSVSAISELVERCEGVFRDERQAWVSMNFDEKKPAKKGKDGSDDKADGKASGSNV
jgi:hypothetical protein